MQTPFPISLDVNLRAPVGISRCLGFAVFPYHQNNFANGAWGGALGQLPGVAGRFPLTARVRFESSQDDLKLLGPDLHFFGRPILELTLESGNTGDALNIQGQSFLVYGFTTFAEWLELNSSPDFPRHRGVNFIACGRAAGSQNQNVNAVNNDPITLADTTGTLGADIRGARSVRATVATPVGKTFDGTGSINWWRFDPAIGWARLMGVSTAPFTAGDTKVITPELELDQDDGRIYAELNGVGASAGTAALKCVLKVS